MLTGSVVQWSRLGGSRSWCRASVCVAYLEALEDRRLLSFSPAVNHTVGINPQDIVTADFNNDGRLDIATVNAGSNNVSVLLGNGAGGFAGSQQFPASND